MNKANALRVSYKKKSKEASVAKFRFSRNTM